MTSFALREAISGEGQRRTRSKFVSQGRVALPSALSASLASVHPDL
eukprot:CAMPEP_0204606394 /NCGR_PEP_ID=MMETSP0661-20131031/59067_1 /ASSEMBLY_ACC=CAM_ASM_000606 /TAXON_ID=109239 /ORGANISM="Alexandrium margalefi, Strain AMGDE01CS-322" /LENGTH=45 /DNA_ID= /DNA_START= /DNA_END= /DNA_ORIENTATION=